MTGKCSMESGELSLCCGAGRVAKCRLVLGELGRRDSRGGPVISRRTTRGRGGVTMMGKVDLWQLCPGVDVRPWVRKPKGSAKMLGDLPVSLGHQKDPTHHQAEKRSNCLSSRRRFWAQSQELLSLSRVIGLFLSEVRTVELLRDLLSTPAAASP